LELSDIDLFVAGSEEAIIMVEGSAKEVREEEILQAILFGHQSLRTGDRASKRIEVEGRDRGKGFRLPGARSIDL